MVLPINIWSLSSAMKVSNAFKNKYFEKNNLHFSDDECMQLIFLLNKFKNEENSNIYDGWVLGGGIQQISAEFDALRIGDDSIVHIELKTCFLEEKTEKYLQNLIRDERRLKIIREKVSSFLFDYSLDILYKLEDGKLAMVDFDCLYSALQFPVFTLRNELSDFDANKYLISPLDQMDAFINEEYILTDSQEQVSQAVQKKIGIFGVEGPAGSGKTLIGFDIIRRLAKKYKVLFIPVSGIHNEHYILREKLNFDVCRPQDISSTIDAQDYDVIVVDEAQRLRGQQRPTLFNWQKKHPAQRKLIFLFDMEQTISRKDDGKVVSSFIKGERGEVFKLSKNIRSNPNIVNFVDGLFHKDQSNKTVNGNVTFEYFENKQQAKNWMASVMQQTKSTLITTIPNQYGASTSYQEWHRLLLELQCKTSNEVLGRESDSVVSFIDDGFYYNKGILTAFHVSYMDYPYYAIGQEYVNLTRPRKHLYLAVVNNPEVYELAVKMTSNSTTK